MNDNLELKYGYVGKIARINLREKSVSIIPTSDYAPRFIGGRAIGNKIFWDEVGAGVGPFDPENKLIFMTGPTAGTGIPGGDRASMTGIAANNIPSQYCWGNIGGFFAAQLKHAGYDGFILEDVADEPTIIVIDDGEIQFHPAGDIWGRLVHDSQDAIKERFGEDYTSMVIGPAGENLVRIASITNSNDSVLAKSGYGAVFGSKKLKGIAVRGTHAIVPADIDHLIALRKTAGDPIKKLNPLLYEEETFSPPFQVFFPIPGGKWETKVSCGGCNQRCLTLSVGCKSAFPEIHDRTNVVQKCIAPSVMMADCTWDPKKFVSTKQNFRYNCAGLSGTTQPQSSDPDPDWIPEIEVKRPGAKLGFFDWDYDRNFQINDLCTELGIDRWDVNVWLIPWLIMGYKTGVLSADDFDGLKIDTLYADTMISLLTDMAYRRGKWGERLAEGMGRMLQELGPKYYETEYHFESGVVEGLDLWMPISFASSWGHCVHWQGRGFEGAGDEATWLPATLMLMVDTRDCQTRGHLKITADTWQKAQKDVYHNPLIAQIAFTTEIKSELKESVNTCERMTPNPYWDDLEVELFNAATGFDYTTPELHDAAIRSMTLFRAIEIRNHGRCRDMEVKEAWRVLQYPDAEGHTAGWEEFNDLVDLYYDLRGWDRKTGWPTRETYEKYGLKDVADEMEKIGKLP